MGTVNGIKKRYGRWEVTGEPFYPDGNRYLYVEVTCTCGSGKSKVVRLTSLNAGSSQSCGCIRKETSRDNATKHGYAAGDKSDSGIYRTWRNILVSARAGVPIKKSWSSFEDFLSDVGDRPHEYARLLRVVPSKGWFPSNVEWRIPKKKRNQGGRDDE